MSWDDPEKIDIVEAEPEDRLMLDLDGYEGPIDVLLTLARDQKVDLTQDLDPASRRPVSRFHRALTPRLQLELAADYLVMAAWLAYLKSRLLLPETDADERAERRRDGGRAGLPAAAAGGDARCRRARSWRGRSSAATSSCAASPRPSTWSASRSTRCRSTSCSRPMASISGAASPVRSPSSRSNLYSMEDGAQALAPPARRHARLAHPIEFPAARLRRGRRRALGARRDLRREPRAGQVGPRGAAPGSSFRADLRPRANGDGE